MTFFFVEILLENEGYSMRAGYIEKPLTAMFRNDMPEPQITAGNMVKIQVKATGICGSEVHAYHGRHAWRVPPLVSGHEFAGIICEVGNDVTAYKVGDRVTAEPQYGCGHCDLCESGNYNLCADKKILGATYWSGSFGEYVVVPEQCVIPLASNVSFEQGALIEPLAVGMHAVRTHEVGRDSTIAVIGCGTIGLGVILSAGCYAPEKIIGIDVVDFNLEKAKEVILDEVKKFDFVDNLNSAQVVLLKQNLGIFTVEAQFWMKQGENITLIRSEALLRIKQRLDDEKISMVNPDNKSGNS